MKKYISFILSAMSVLLSTHQAQAQSPFMKVVAVDGTGDFSSLQEAIGQCPADGTRSFIFLRNGTYKEQVTIPKGVVLSIIGESRDGAIVTHDVSHASGLDKDKTSTIYVEGFDFYGENFTTQHTAGRNGGQAECITNSGDRMVLRGVAMKGNQDAVRLDNASRTYMADCYIEGTVDYIYDSGVAFLDRCDIRQLYPGYVIAPGNSYVALSRAQVSKLCGQRGTKPWYLGIVVRDSRLLRDEQNVPDGQSHLGRPWGKTTSAGVFIRCKMDKHISPEGFANMSEGTTPYIGEWQSTDLDGNPLNMSDRISWEFTSDDTRGTLYYMNEEAVKNVYDNMQFVYELAGEKGARAGGGFDPLPMVTPTASPQGITSDGHGSFSWQAVDGAAGYIVYKDSRYAANTSAPRYVDADFDPRASYTVRTVSATGCLGQEVNLLTSSIATPHAAVNIVVSPTRVQWSFRAKARLFDRSGRTVATIEGEGMSLETLPKGCYILRVITDDGISINQKILKP